jgi:hypothetical protein
MQFLHAQWRVQDHQGQIPLLGGRNILIRIAPEERKKISRTPKKSAPWA